MLKMKVLGQKILFKKIESDQILHIFYLKATKNDPK